MPLRVGLLRVDDRDVEVERRHRGQPFAGERAGDRLDRVRVLGQRRAVVAAQDRERQAGGGGDVAVGHPGVAVLLDLELVLLHRLAEAVQRADARVAAPGEDQLARAAGADQLVVDDVRRHPHERQIALALADDLLPRGDGDQVGEALERDGVAVVDEVGDRVGEGCDLGVCAHNEQKFGQRTVSSMLSPMRTQVAIVGGGPAGLMLGRLLELRGIESVILEARDREYVQQRVRAGVLEQATMDLMDEVGLGARMHAEGLVHHGVELRFDGEGHRIALIDLTGGRAITIYGQQEVVKDLIDARLESDLPLHFEVSDVVVDPSHAVGHATRTTASRTRSSAT